MNSRLRRPAVALISTALAASVLGIAPAAYAADGTLTGTVTGSGGPVESVEVELYQYEADGEGGGFWYQTGDYAFTDVDGDYSLTVPAGDYRVGFDGGFGDYAFEYYQDADTVEEGNTVTVPSDGTVQADAMLGAAAHVSGDVTDPDGVPVDDVIVAAYQVVGAGSDVDYRYVGFATTTSGSYDIGGLPAGTYVVGFEGIFAEASATYATEYFNDQPNKYVADELTLTTAQSRLGVDAQLELDSTISGTVTDVNGDPVDNGFVSAQVEVGAVWQDIDYADIASDGTYTIDGLAADTYRVCFSADVVDGYAYECWNNQGDVSTATDIGLGLNANAPGIDAQLINGEFVPPADPPVVNTSAPAISGTPQVGSSLTVSPGTWSPTPTSFDYYWFAGDAFVQGGTSATYVPTAADLGKVISVDVYAGAAGYDYGYAYAVSSGPVVAAPVAPVPAPPTPTPTPTPTVDVPAGLAAILANLDTSGKPKVGKTVKVTHIDLVLRTAVTYKFQWFAGTKKIKKATKYKLKVLSSMKGKKLSVKVTATAASTSKSVKLKVGKVR